MRKGQLIRKESQDTHYISYTLHLTSSTLHRSRSTIELHLTLTEVTASSQPLELLVVHVARLRHPLVRQRLRRRRALRLRLHRRRLLGLPPRSAPAGAVALHALRLRGTTRLRRLFPAVTVTVTVRRSSRSGVLAARCLLMRIHGWRWMGLCRRQSRSRDHSSFVCRLVVLPFLLGGK